MMTQPENIFEFLMQKCEDKFYYWPELSERDRFIIYHVCEMVSVWMKAHNALLVIPTSGKIANNDRELSTDVINEFALYLIGPESNNVVSNSFRLYKEACNDQNFIKHATRATLHELAVKLVDELYKEQIP